MVEEFAYKYPVEECDVEDKDRLHQFRKMRTKWIEWLRGHDIHSIRPQINKLLWDDVLFRTVNDLRRLAIENPNEDVGFNEAVLSLFDAGFVATQATAIRRLTERPMATSRNKNRGVISLGRLITDIKNHHHLLTREFYVSHDGCPYDPKPIKDEWLRTKSTKMSSMGITTEALPYFGPSSWGNSEEANNCFDILSGLGPANRSRDDLIESHWFDWLFSELSVCDDIRKYTDKFLAHAAEPHSRKELTHEQIGVTLKQLRLCQKAIFETARFLHGPLLWVGESTALPIPTYNQLENLDKRWVSQDGNEAAETAWKIHSDILEKWEVQPSWPKEYFLQAIIGHNRDPYEYLDRFLTEEELNALDSLEYRSKKYSDKVVDFLCKPNSCGDVRQRISKAFETLG